MSLRPLTENERWLLSYYRSSEINGALFFGRLARSLRPGPIQADMTRHFADESQHARLWTDCLAAFGETALKLGTAYQDQYLEAGGMPVNLMEILAVTLVFERRVIGQYVAHLKASNLQEPIRRTLQTIMEDEKWHIHWVTAALEDMKKQHGASAVDEALTRYTHADREVYRKTLGDHESVVGDLMTFRPR